MATASLQGCAVSARAQNLSEARQRQRHALLLALAQDRSLHELISHLVAFLELGGTPGSVAVAWAAAAHPPGFAASPPGADPPLPGFTLPEPLPLSWQPLASGLPARVALAELPGGACWLGSGSPPLATAVLWPARQPGGPLLGGIAVAVPPEAPLPTQAEAEVAEALAWLAVILERQRERRLFERRVALERVVRNISVRLLSCSDHALAVPIQHALQQLGEFIGADRCYLMQHSPDGETIDNTYEWCASGIAPQIEELQQLPTVQLQNWLDLLQAQNLLVIRRREDMPPNPHWARIFEEGGIQSVLFVPMVHNNTLIGLLGFDAVRAPKDWEPGTVTLVQLVADLLVHAILRQALVEALRYDADHDPLTGLANRRHIEQSLANEAERVRRYGGTFSIIMFDIDHFKRVNDNYGHDVGDEVLRVLAGLVSNHRRRTDPIARWGGEEFLLMLPQTDVHTAFQVAEHLRRLVAAARFPIQDGPLTISLGVAGFTAGDDWHDTIAAADSALYLAKQAGRNQVKVAAMPEVVATLQPAMERSVR